MRVLHRADGARILDDERRGVDAKPRQPELEPEPDDAGDLVLHGRIGGVEVGLVPVEAVVVHWPAVSS